MSKQHILTERPWLFWIMGLVFGGLGIWLLFTPEMTSKIIAAVFIGIGLLLGVLLAATTRLSLDQARGVLEIDYHYLYRRAHKEIPLDELASIDIERSHSSDSGYTYRLVFVMRSGEVIPLHSYYSSGYLGKQRMADQIRQAVGMPAYHEQLAQAAHSLIRPHIPAPIPERSGVTNGVAWKIETRYYGAMPVTRWISQDFSLPGDFLLLAQNIPGMKSPGGLMKAISGLFLRQFASIYGFSEGDLPGMNQARIIEQTDSRLAAYFTAISSSPDRLFRLLHPWVTTPLINWAAKRPLRQAASETEATGQLAMLIGPSGVILALFQDASGESLEELVNTGAEVVRSLQSIAPQIS